MLCILLVEQFLFHKLWILEAAAHPMAAAAPAHQVLLYVAACFMIKQFFMSIIWDSRVSAGGCNVTAIITSAIIRQGAVLFRV